jgi:hypothetical protein
MDKDTALEYAKPMLNTAISMVLSNGITMLAVYEQCARNPNLPELMEKFLRPAVRAHIYEGQAAQQSGLPEEVRNELMEYAFKVFDKGWDSFMAGLKTMEELTEDGRRPTMEEIVQCYVKGMNLVLKMSQEQEKEG